MESLSVTNLQSYELNNNSNDKQYISSHYLKSNDKTNNNTNNKYNLKFNFKNFATNSAQFNLNRNDSGYMSCTSAETVFSIDNSNYVSFRRNPYLRARHQQYSSTQSLYDKSLLDLSEVFGLNANYAKTLSNPKRSSININNNNKESNRKSYDSLNRAKSPKILSLSAISAAKISDEKDFQIKYENRSWDQIYRLSDLALNKWLANRRVGNNFMLNNTFGSKTYDYFEPNIEVKNSLLLNSNLLYQPIRRYTSELNLRKLVYESTQLFSDDFQIESNLISDENLIQTKEYSVKNTDPEPKTIVAEDIYSLFMDLHEFRINDDNIDRVSDKICKIDKYLFRHISSKDLVNYIFGKNLCGCRLNTICAVIQFSQALSQIIIDCIDTKIAVYQRIAYIIAFIKVSMSLYQKSNWQSLNTVICALQSFRIYRLHNEWLQIHCNHKHYFDEFIKLTAIVRSSDTSLMYTIPRGIPSLKTLLISKRMDCMSRWDRMEWPTKWSQHPGIIDWLERELKSTMKSFIANNENKSTEGLRESSGVSDSSCKTNGKHFICLIPMTKLPENWLNRSAKNIPLEYRHKMFEFLSKSLKNELKF